MHSSSELQLCCKPLCSTHQTTVARDSPRASRESAKRPRCFCLQAATRWRYWWATARTCGIASRLRTSRRAHCSRMQTRWTATLSAAFRALRAPWGELPPRANPPAPHSHSAGADLRHPLVQLQAPEAAYQFTALQCKSRTMAGSIFGSLAMEAAQCNAQHLARP